MIKAQEVDYTYILFTSFAVQLFCCSFVESICILFLISLCKFGKDFSSLFVPSIHINEFVSFWYKKKKKKNTTNEIFLVDFFFKLLTYRDEDATQTRTLLNLLVGERVAFLWHCLGDALVFKSFSLDMVGSSRNWKCF